MNYFPKDNPVEYVHGAVDQVHGRGSKGVRSQLNEDRPIPNLR
jgi:hypothetical protein